MAKADQIKALIASHLSRDDQHFRTVALQLAANEARKGHGALASEIRKMIDERPVTPARIVSMNGELDDLVIAAKPLSDAASLVVAPSLERKLDRIVSEYRQADKLRRHGLVNRRKILLAGPPGTGKTLTASALAKRTGLPLLVVQIDRLISKYLGETNAKLRLIFAMIRDRPGLYFFDEFDTIGTARGAENDVGEMRRVMNALLQFIEADDSSSLIIAATNSPEALDSALFRRFDDILDYGYPDGDEIAAVIDNRLGGFRGRFKLDRVVSTAQGLSHSDIVRACDDAVKDAILDDRSALRRDDLVAALRERKAVYPA